MNEGLYFKVFIENTSDVVICLSSEFLILAFNKHAESFYKWQNKKVLGENFLTLCAQFHYTSPIHEQFFVHPVYQELTQDFLNHQGNMCTIDWRICPLVNRENMPEVILFGKDVTLKKNTIAHYLDKIVACTPGSLYWKDRQGRYLGCNEFMVKTAGLNTPKDIIGKTDVELWGEEANAIVQNDDYVMRTGKILYLEEKVRIPNGKLLYFTGVKMPLKDENEQIVGMIGNSLDITELKRTQKRLAVAKKKAELSDQLKTNFIRDMQHDIRTPVAGMLGMAKILHDEENNGQKKDALLLIEESAKELLDYLNHILDFSKVEKQKTAILVEDINLKALMERVLSLEKPAAKLKNLQLKLYYDPQLPHVIQGDAYRLQRILINLLSNAIKFTDQGYVQLRVQAVATDTDAQTIMIEFTVQDTGMGIPLDKEKIIFKKFVRLTPANEETYKGQGLGLYIVRYLVNELGGKVTVKSKLGEGSLFICRLPFNLPLIK